MSSTQSQTQSQMQLQFLDNGVHRLIIALERLEIYLAELYQLSKPDKMVAIGTARDLHNDSEVIPTKASYYNEVHLQTLNVSKQGRFADGSEMVDFAATYFLQDILEWYSLRIGGSPCDIERFAVPIIAAITDKKLQAKDITDLVYKYVGDLENDLSKKAEKEKERAIAEGFEAFLKAQGKVIEETRKLESGDSVVQLTSHTRGNVLSGYQHLLQAFQILYPKDSAPIQLLQREINRLCPSILQEAVNNSTDSNINQKS